LLDLLLIIEVFPCISLSSLHALKPSSLLKPQRRFSAAEQICVRLVYEDPPWFTYPTSSHPHSSLIAFISLMHDLILIGSIIGLFFYTSSTSINLYLPRYSLQDPSSILSYLASSGCPSEADLGFLISCS